MFNFLFPTFFAANAVYRRGGTRTDLGLEKMRDFFKVRSYGKEPKQRPLFRNRLLLSEPIGRTFECFTSLWSDAACIFQNSRRGVPKTAVLITDGDPLNTYRCQEQSKMAYSEGINMFIVSK